jgi:hypothetical protein
MMFKSVFKNNEIEFLCAEEDYGVIPTPFPSSKHIPDWFKALPPRLGDQGFQTSTIKRCMPFLDSMLMGYIIPLAADVQITSNDNCSGITYKSNFYRPMIENHIKEQVTSEKSPNPLDPKPPIKFMNYWMFKTPPGYSLLFLPPLNRPDPRFTCFSGTVDYPYYEQEYVNFPFTFNQPNFAGIIPAGTPLVQVIPIKKDDLLPKHRSRSFTENEIKSTHLMRTIRDFVHESLYKDKLHKKLPK